MKSRLLILSLILGMSTQARTVVSTMDVSVDVQGEIEYATIETEEACVLKYDPQWSHEEDTRYASTLIVNNYSSKKRSIDALTKKGFRFAGYSNGDVCSFSRNGFTSTFPKLKNPNPSEGDIFSQFIRNSKLAEYARAQGAFKTVRRVYVKGDQEFIKKAEAQARKSVQEVLDAI